MTIDREQKYREMARSQAIARDCIRNRAILRRSSGGLPSARSSRSSVSCCPRPHVFTGPGAKMRAAATYGHSQALAWSVAGWEMAELDMDSETLLLRRHRLLTFNTANSSCYEDRIEPVGG